MNPIYCTFGIGMRMWNKKRHASRDGCWIIFWGLRIAENRKKHPIKIRCFGGEAEIRTLETLLRPTRFPVVRPRPTRRLLHWSITFILYHMWGGLSRGFLNFLKKIAFRWNSDLEWYPERKYLCVYAQTAKHLPHRSVSIPVLAYIISFCFL